MLMHFRFQTIIKHFKHWCQLNWNILDKYLNRINMISSNLFTNTQPLSRNRIKPNYPLKFIRVDPNSSSCGLDEFTLMCSCVQIEQQQRNIYTQQISALSSTLCMSSNCRRVHPITASRRMIQTSGGRSSTWTR